MRPGGSFLFREGVAALARSRRGALFAALMTAITIFGAGLFHSLATGLATMARGWAEESLLVVYLTPGLDVDGEGATEVLSLLEASSTVTGVERVSAETARDRLLRLYGGVAGGAAEIGAGSLPSSLEATLSPTASDTARQDLISNLVRLEPVEEVQYDREWVARLERVAAGVRWVGVLLLGLLGTGAALTASGTTRFSLLGARDEIRVLRLVGATEWMIRGPYVVAGAAIGLAGSGLAILLLFATLLSTGGLVQRELPILPGDLLPPPGPLEVGGLIVLGLVAATIGSWVACHETDHL